MAISVELRCPSGVKRDARLEFTAQVLSSGQTQQFATAVVSSGGPTTATRSVKVCALTGASDLPGSAFGLFAAGVDSSLFDAGEVVLGPDTSAPKLTVHASPPSGAKVSPGDRIHVEVTASEARDASWQTGVHTTQLTGPGGSLGDEDAGGVPKACKDKSWSQNLEATYKVPRHPPPVVEICAITEDYVPNDATKCVHLYTADEVWEGTVHADGNFGGCLQSWDGRLAFAVDGKGRISGQGTVATTGQPGCTVVGGNAFVPYSEDFGITGRTSDERFDFKFVDPTDTCVSLAGTGASVRCWGVAGGTIRRSDERAEATITTELGRTVVKSKLSLRCATC
ncbi:MAG TPA: hypothetical protein VIH82_14890 [Acidimicrobiia bacterium]